MNRWTKDIILSPDFIVNSEGQPEEEILIVGTIGSFMGSDKVVTTDDLYKKIEELGLKLCSSRIGPELRLQYQDQPYGEYLYIGMKQIADSGGDLGIFRLYHGDDRLWLDDRWVLPGHEWGPVDAFVFSVRKQF